MRAENWIYTVPLRLCWLLRRQQVEHDLEDEIRDHLERRTADYIAKDLSPEEAVMQRGANSAGSSKGKKSAAIPAE
jgi:hypothetical protein